MKQNQLKLKNYMEDIVVLLIEEVIKDKDICKCEQCRLDIAAIALNKLPPKYIVTGQGEAYAKTDLLCRQFRTDVLIQLLDAIDIVSKNPHHNTFEVQKLLLESSCVGIDLGTESIKAAYLVKRNNRIKTLDLYQMENPVGNTVFNTPKEQEIIKKCFMKINNIFPCKDVVIGVPSKHAVFRHVQFPLLSKKELREAIFWETQEFSTIFNSEFISDYELLDKQKDIYNVLLVGVTKDIITNYIKIAHDVNFHLRALDVYPLANARVLRTQKASKVIAIVDLQSSYSEITVVANGKIVFNRNLDFRFTTTVKNEMYDIITTYSNSSDFIRNEVRTLPQHFQNLLLEISRSINFYSLHSKGCQVDELLLIGKGIELQNCKDIIKNFLGIKVNTTKEFKFEFMNKNIELNHKIIDYFSALGFALRGRG